MNTDRYLTTAAAAHRLGIKTRTIYHAIRYRGFPEPKRFGTAMLHDPDEIDAWRDRHPARTPHMTTPRP